MMMSNSLPVLATPVIVVKLMKTEELPSCLLSFVTEQIERSNPLDHRRCRKYHHKREVRWISLDRLSTSRTV